MGRGEPGGGKERGLRHKGEPSLRGGGWGDNLMPGVPFKGERYKLLNSRKIMHNGYTVVGE